MTKKIKELPLSERPYEKLELYGESRLSNAELLAIIIKSGTKEQTSVELAQEILTLNRNLDKEENLLFLQGLSIEELMRIKGIGKVKAIQIKAVCELAKRMARPTNYRQIVVLRAGDVANLLMEEMRHERQEIVKVVILNSRNAVLKIVDVTLGGANFSSTMIKDILAEPIKMQAPKIILVHNHPSGDPRPSTKDIEFTKNLKAVTTVMGIELLDHIVIGDTRYISIFDNYKIKIE